MIHVTVYNLSVAVQTDERKLIDIIEDFLKKNYTIKTPAYSGSAQIPDKQFVSKLAKHPVYYLHINQFRHLLYVLKEVNYNLKDIVRVDEREFEVASGGYAVRDGWVLRQDQQGISDFITEDPTGTKLVSLQTGKGKASSLDAKVKVPNGWKLMRDIEVGDVVTAADGTPTVVNGVYPQGVIPMYRIIFADGRSTEVSGDHLWKIFYVNTVKHRRWRIADTNEIARLIGLPNPRVYIPLIESEDGPEVELPLDPYLLGVLIGDGGMTQSTIYLSTPDQHILDKVRELLPENGELNHRDNYDYSFKKTPTITKALKDMGLFGKYSYEKFIPEIYKHASRSQRLLLLQGLLDTDGTIGTNKYITYCTTSPQLCEDVKYLVRSLGGIARSSTKNTSFTHNGEKRNGRLSYIVGIRYKKPTELFTLPKKKDRADKGNQYSETLKLRVKSVEPIQNKAAQCISIDHPDKLYVTDDFIVTHNTFVALHSLAKVNMRIGVVILPAFIDKWVQDVATIHDAQVMDVMVIQGSKSIKSIIQMAKEGTLSAKYFIFSSRTMQEYISDYEENTDQHLEVYGIHPVQLFPLLKIGSLLIDETHMQFHAIFKIILHCNVRLQVGLSATLISDDPVVSRVHRIVYPDKTVYDPGELDRYTDVYALGYSVPADLLRQVKTTNYGSKSYSHTAFEQSVMRSPALKKFYYSLIDNAMKDYYTSQYEAKDKCLIFVATIKMATELTQRYEQMHPDKVVRRYCEDDPFEHVNEGEIIVSTVLSAGTAIDIADLRVVVQTVSISSSVSNIQTLGRLRKLKGGRDTRFCYLFADNLPKQKQYHYRRLELFRTRVASHRTFRAKATY